MPLNQQWLDATANDEVEYKTYVSELRSQLAYAEQEVEIWDSAGPFMARLRDMESSALELMVSGPPEDMAPTRERVKVIRSLLDGPRMAAAKVEEIERELERALAVE